jgi:L-ribulose-5-phosphate 3-epimerase
MLNKHPLGLYEKALNPDLSWTEKLKTVKALGFDFIEISIDEDDSRLNRLYISDEEIEQMRRACYEQQVPVRSMCLSAHRRFPFGSSNTKTRDKAFEIMQLAILFAAKIGIRVIQLAGYDVYYETSTAESLCLFLEGMRRAIEMAEREQVMLALEIMDTPLYSSITDYFALGLPFIPTRVT